MQNDTEILFKAGFFSNLDYYFADTISKIAKEKNWKRLDVTAPTDGNEKAVKLYKENGFIFTRPKMKLRIV